MSRMFSNDVMATWYNAPKCPQCQQILKASEFFTAMFPVSAARAIFKSSIISENAKPLILPCGHLICETCAVAATNYQVTCAVCGEISRKDRRLISMQFPMDFYLNGFLQYVEFKAPHHLEYTRNFSPPSKLGHKPSFYSASGDQRQLCYECQVTRTDRLCVQCNLAFCAACFKTVHSSRALRRHELRHGGNHHQHPDNSGGGALARFSAEHTACRRHPGVEQKYYCKPCGQAICVECKRERHDQHGNVVALLQEVRYDDRSGRLDVWRQF